MSEMIQEAFAASGADKLIRDSEDTLFPVLQPSERFDKFGGFVIPVPADWLWDNDADNPEFVKPGKAGLFTGGVTAGVGAVVAAVGIPLFELAAGVAAVQPALAGAGIIAGVGLGATVGTVTGVRRLFSSRAQSEQFEAAKTFIGYELAKWLLVKYHVTPFNDTELQGLVEQLLPEQEPLNGKVKFKGHNSVEYLMVHDPDTKAWYLHTVSLRKLSSRKMISSIWPVKSRRVVESVIGKLKALALWDLTVEDAHIVLRVDNELAELADVVLRFSKLRSIHAEDRESIHNTLLGLDAELSDVIARETRLLRKELGVANTLVTGRELRSGLRLHDVRRRSWWKNWYEGMTQ